MAVQRARRVCRLESPHKVVRIVSFLPEEGLGAHLGLVRALDERFGLIHFLGRGDEPVTKLPGDYQAVTFEQFRRLYADEATVLDEVEHSFARGATDYMRQPLEAFLREAAESKLAEIPVGVQSARAAPKDWPYGPGVFIAFRLGKPGRARPRGASTRMGAGWPSLMRPPSSAPSSAAATSRGRRSRPPRVRVG